MVKVLGSRGVIREGRGALVVGNWGIGAGGLDADETRFCSDATAHAGHWRCLCAAGGIREHPLDGGGGGGGGGVRDKHCA